MTKYYLKATVTVSLSETQYAAMPKSDSGFLKALNLHCAAINRIVQPDIANVCEALDFLGYETEVDWSGPAQPCCECGD